MNIKHAFGWRKSFGLKASVLTDLNKGCDVANNFFGQGMDKGT